MLPVCDAPFYSTDSINVRRKCKPAKSYTYNLRLGEHCFSANSHSRRLNAEAVQQQVKQVKEQTK